MKKKQREVGGTRWPQEESGIGHQHWDINPLPLIYIDKESRKQCPRAIPKNTLNQLIYSRAGKMYCAMTVGAKRGNNNTAGQARHFRVLRH